MKRAAIRIYWWASLLAVSEAFLFFSFGLELRPEQVKLLLLYGWPAPILMYLCDRWLITCHVRPIDDVLSRQRTGQKADLNEGLGAYVQALNLPVLTLLRASEKTPPQTLLRWLNNFFTEMVAAVEDHGGVVNQFTGDGVMVLFGAPATQSDHATRAVRSALSMLKRLQSFNELRQEQGDAPIRIGIGIHTGEVVAGCVGPDTRFTYSVVGDTVNLASRVQDLTKELGVALLITEATAARVKPEFTFGKRAVLTVRGKDQPVEVIEVRPGASG